MASVYKVLAPMDLRFDTEAQVHYAAGVANSLGGELVLLHVSTARWYQHSHRLGWPPSASGGQAPSLDIHRLVLPGPVPETIVRYADHIDADMLLMTTRTHGSHRRLWRTSVTADVMRATSRPVCVRKQGDVDLSGCFRCRRLLCVVGLDGQDAAILEHVRNVALRSSAQLILLHIVPPVNEGLLAYGVECHNTRPLSAKLATEKLAGLVKDLDVPVRTSVKIGSPAKCIAAAAREYAADLVLTSRVAPGARLERSGVYTADLRSALSRLGCPLLTVPVGDKLVAVNRHRVEERDVVLTSRIRL